MRVARPVRRAGRRNGARQLQHALRSDPYTEIPTLEGPLYLAWSVPKTDREKRLLTES